MEKFDASYMEMAAIWAKNSYCRRRQVGALIVKDRMIISDGYNGTPSGFENVCEDEHGVTKPYVLHAECNYESCKVRKQQRRRDPVRDCRTLHRMCKTDYPVRHKEAGLP